jgi:hypothetical protein
VKEKILLRLPPLHFLNINFMAVVLPSKQQYESTARAPLGCSTAGAARNTTGVPYEYN